MLSKFSVKTVYRRVAVYPGFHSRSGLASWNMTTDVFFPTLRASL